MNKVREGVAYFKYHVLSYITDVRPFIGLHVQFMYIRHLNHFTRASRIQTVKANDNDTVEFCQLQFGYLKSNVLWARCVRKFDSLYRRMPSVP